MSLAEELKSSGVPLYGNHMFGKAGVGAIEKGDFVDVVFDDGPYNQCACDAKNPVMNMAFRFDPLLYVNPGFETSRGEMDDETRDQIARIRQAFPEIGEWGDAAIYTAWGAFSDSVRMMGWSDDIERTDDFLNFLCWEQTRGPFPWGSGTEQLSEASEWKPN